MWTGALVGAALAILLCWPDRRELLALPEAVDCPGGAAIAGGPPPLAHEAWCERRNDGAQLKHGPYRGWYGNGRLKAEGSFVEGLRDGRWRAFHLNGKRASIGSYQRGVQAGPWRFFRPDETLEQEAWFVAGQLHGISVTYHPNGHQRRVELWVRGQRHGVVHEFHDNGELATIGEYDRDKKNGIWVACHRSGLPSRISLYDEDRLDAVLGYQQLQDHDGERAEVMTSYAARLCRYGSSDGSAASRADVGPSRPTRTR